MTEGIYESLINKLLRNKLDSLDKEEYFIQESKLDRTEAASYLGNYLNRVIQEALVLVKDEEKLDKQILISNKIIQVLVDEVRDLDIPNNLVEASGQVLEAVFRKIDSPYPDLAARLKQIMPYTRLSQSELFTGNHSGVTLDSEIKKEILSSDTIYWLVSFIKFSGVRIFMAQLEQFTNSGKKLKIITTSYMGATDVAAIEYLASLKNTEIKISYNTQHERLHAKAYLFLRNTGFNTGYIGSSNFSRSALTNGLEWNIKVTSQEISHIIDKFQKTFETYWEDNEFETYRVGIDRDRLRKALSSQKVGDQQGLTTFFEIKPFTFQNEILEKLQAERDVHQRFRNLVVAATGTGKTMISAFDYQNFVKENPNAKLLFIAHRKEILEQAQQSFRQVLKDGNFGQLWVSNYEPDNYSHLFASIQTMNSRLEELQLSEDFYDYIVIDEVHHVAAKSYRSILKHFQPKLLLGLTATPERTDGADILEDFDQTIAAEIRLPEALNRKLLSPFQYFGVSDQIDLSQVHWRQGRYDITELSKLYIGNDRRVAQITLTCQKYLSDINEVRALGFCVNKEHAEYMAQKFVLAGLKANFLTGDHDSRFREQVRWQLRNKEINYLFVVDVFNEGIDIPEIDTVLFLRPTESLTIFLQQLGRGLRLSEDKECLTVLDFVGNSRPEYDFERKFRALVGRTHTTISKEIQDEFPHLPLGSSIVLEKQAREIILKNIKQATSYKRRNLFQKIKQYQYDSSLPLSLKNFCEFYQIPLEVIYKRDNWSRLCVEAGVLEDFTNPHEKQLTSSFKNKIIANNSLSYLSFIKELLIGKKNIEVLSAVEKRMALMFHYDIWQQPGSKLQMTNLKDSFSRLLENDVLVKELRELIDYLMSKVDVIEKPIDVGFPFPLQLHSRYSREQILVAMEDSTFFKASSNREGVSLNKEHQTEALFITLKKSDKEYSPSTQYNDYAISEYLFHWQSQNHASAQTPKGKAYIDQRESDLKILLFVREQSKDEYGYSMNYVFLGLADFVSFEGAKPMNIEWKLREPIPAYIYHESAKLAVG